MTFIFKGGNCRTLWTDKVDLRELGTCQVQRASTIDFNAASQNWEVRIPNQTTALFSDPSRQACLDWEDQNQELLLNSH